MIVSNQIKCLKCGDTPYSSHRHDYRTCKCGAVAVDGGAEYLRRIGDPELIQDMSIFVEDEVFKACLKALEWCDDTKRNNRGRVCAIFRALRDSGYIDVNN